MESKQEPHRRRRGGPRPGVCGRRWGGLGRGVRPGCRLPRLQRGRGLPGPRGRSLCAPSCQPRGPRQPPPLHRPTSGCAGRSPQTPARSGLVCPQGLPLLGSGCCTLGTHRRRRGRGADRRPPGAVALRRGWTTAAMDRRAVCRDQGGGEAAGPEVQASRVPGLRPDSSSQSHGPLEAALLAPGTPGFGWPLPGRCGYAGSDQQVGALAVWLSETKTCERAGYRWAGGLVAGGREERRAGSPGGCGEAGEGLRGPQRGGAAVEAPRLTLHPVPGRERARFRTSGAEFPASGRCGQCPGAVTGWACSVCPTHRHPGCRAVGQHPAHPGSPSPQPRLRPHTLHAGL